MLPSIGSLALGIFMGFMAWYFIKRLKEYTTDGLIAVVGVLLGGVIVTFLDWTPTVATGTAGGTATAAAGAGDVLHRWWYPVGLLVGFVAWYIAEWVRTGKAPSLAGETV